MRILVIVPELSLYGGATCFLERLLEIHSKQGFSTILLVPDNCASSIEHLATPPGTEIILAPNKAGVETASFLTPWYDFLFSWRAAFFQRPDLIVVSTGNPGRMSIALYYPVPVLYVLHTIPERKLSILPRVYLRLSMLFNNFIVTVSKAAAAAISKNMGFPENTIAILPNSCRPFDTVCEAGKGSMILTVGHLVSYKNPEMWLAVAKKVIQLRPDAVFVWVGDGDCSESIRREVAECGLEDRVHISGYSENPSLWYRQAQIYFQPSLTESQGIAVLEAMGHGLPCVVSDVGGLPESVQNGLNGFVVRPDDIDGFVGALVLLLDNTDHLREHMGVEGVRKLKEKFSEEQQERDIVQLYRKLTT